MVVLEKNKIYSVNEETNKNIFRYSHNNVASSYIGNNGSIYKINGGNFNNKLNYIEANDFDKAWLIYCENINDFISEEDFKKIYNEKLNYKLELW